MANLRMRPRCGQVFGHSTTAEPGRRHRSVRRVRRRPAIALGSGGSHSAGDPAGTNLVQVLTKGTQIETNQGLMFMHAFTGAYTDEELAARRGSCRNRGRGSRDRWSAAG